VPGMRFPEGKIHLLYVVSLCSPSLAELCLRQMAGLDFSPPAGGCANPEMTAE